MRSPHAHGLRMAYGPASPVIGHRHRWEALEATTRGTRLGNAGRRSAAGCSVHQSLVTGAGKRTGRLPPMRSTLRQPLVRRNMHSGRAAQAAAALLNATRNIPWCATAVRADLARSGATRSTGYVPSGGNPDRRGAGCDEVRSGPRGRPAPADGDRS